MDDIFNELEALQAMDNFQNDVPISSPESTPIGTPALDLEDTSPTTSMLTNPYEDLLPPSRKAHDLHTTALTSPCLVNTGDLFIDTGVV